MLFDDADPDCLHCALLPVIKTFVAAHPDGNPTVNFCKILDAATCWAALTFKAEDRQGILEAAPRLVERLLRQSFAQVDAQRNRH